MKVSEIFESIQGEGLYAGSPVLFIRLSGCTRDCSFCDSPNNKDGKEMTVDEVVERINSSDKSIIVWTGGEPMLQYDEILEVIKKLGRKSHHMETNGDIRKEMWEFSYVAYSPKDKETAIKINNSTYDCDFDIKVVTDLELNKDLIQYASRLMPLTTGNETIDKVIARKVWNYCIENNIKYCARIHIDVWNGKKGV